MKNYNFFYDGNAINRKTFENAVPVNWESEVINGEYSYGYFRAIERD